VKSLSRRFGWQNRDAVGLGSRRLYMGVAVC